MYVDDVPKMWNDDLLELADDLSAGQNTLAKAALAELARRYRVAIEVEADRRAAARKAFGELQCTCRQPTRFGYCPVHEGGNP